MNAVITNKGNGGDLIAKSGKCLTFDGATSFVDTGKPLTFDRDDTLEIEFSIRPNQNTSAQFLFLYRDFNNYPNQRGFQLYIFNYKIYFTIRQGYLLDDIVIFSNEIPYNKWSKAKIVYNGDNTSGLIEINDVDQTYSVTGSLSATVEPIDSVNLYVGARYRNDSDSYDLHFDGKLSNIKITVNGTVVRDYKVLKGVDSSDILFDSGSDKAHATVNNCVVETGLSGKENSETHDGIPQTVNEEWNGYDYFDGSSYYIIGSDANFPSGGDARTVILDFLYDDYSATNEPIFNYGTQQSSQKFYIGVDRNANIVQIGINGGNRKYAIPTSYKNQIIQLKVTSVDSSLANIGVFINDVALSFVSAAGGGTINTVLDEYKINFSDGGEVGNKLLLFRARVYSDATSTTKVFDITNASGWVDSVNGANGTINGSPVKLNIPQDLSNLGSDIFGEIIQHSIKDGSNNQVGFSFDGESYIDFLSLFTEDNFSMFFIIDGDFTGTQTIFDNTDGANDGLLIYLSSGDLVVKVNGDTNTFTIPSSKTLISIIVDDNYVRIRLNGNEGAALANTGGAINSATNPRLGATQSDTNYADCNILDPRIISRAVYGQGLIDLEDTIKTKHNIS